MQKFRFDLEQQIPLIPVRVFGDIIQIQELVISLSKTNKGALFEEKISLKVYTIESIFAEKYETACFRGAGNSRMKDYHDLWMIIRDSSALDIAVLQKAIKQTFSHRNTSLELIPAYSGDDGVLSASVREIPFLTMVP